MPTVRSILALILLAGALRAQTASVKQAQQLATEQYLRTRDYSSLQEQQKAPPGRVAAVGLRASVGAVRRAVEREE
jgi:hypothetical protein